MQTFGVALGGGGVRGLAHVPALETLDDLGIRPRELAGTSMGAIIGALYASGLSGRDIRELVGKYVVTKGEGLTGVYRKKSDLLKSATVLSPAWSRGGLFTADRFLRHLLAEIAVTTFEELAIPLAVVATDYHRGEPVVFRKGPLFPALRASMSIPGVFVPVLHEGRILVDGGLVNNLPYDLLADRCKVTIAIDVAPTRLGGDGGVPGVLEATLGMFDILLETTVASKIRVRPPTFYVHPRLVNIRTLEFHKVDQVFEQAGPAMADLRVALEDLRAVRGLRRLRGRGRAATSGGLGDGG